MRFTNYKLLNVQVLEFFKNIKSFSKYMQLFFIPVLLKKRYEVTLSL
jgi:hypothetical protein